jgi:hypothetical protein
MYKFQAVGQDIAVLPSGPVTGNKNPYCENLLPNMCAKTQSVIDKAKRDCWEQSRGQIRGLFGSGLGKTCTLYSWDAQVGANHANMWDPCMLAKLQVCTGGPPPANDDSPETTPTPVVPPPSDDPDGGEDVTEDDSGQFLVGGILGLLVLGGIGYAVFKNRKKFKKKKGKR